MPPVSSASPSSLPASSGSSSRRRPDRDPPHSVAWQLESTTEPIAFELKGEHVRLCDLMKLAGIAESGGQGKHFVADGELKVDGQLESRKSAKIRAGQIVECRGVKIAVK